MQIYKRKISLKVVLVVNCIALGAVSGFPINAFASPSEDKRVLGDKLLAGGNAEAALHFYDQSISLNNANWKAYIHRGDALSKMGHAQFAAEDYKKALQLYPGCPEALARLHRSGHKSTKHHS